MAFLYFKKFLKILKTFYFMFRYIIMSEQIKQKLMACKSKLTKNKGRWKP